VHSASALDRCGPFSPDGGRPSSPPPPSLASPFVIGIVVKQVYGWLFKSLVFPSPPLLPVDNSGACLHSSTLPSVFGIRSFPPLIKVAASFPTVLSPSILDDTSLTAPAFLSFQQVGSSLVFLFLLNLGGV